VTWRVIVNPTAGRRGEVASRVVAALKARAVDFDLGVSESADHVRELTAAGIAAGHRRFISVGGDGTANVVCDVLMQHDWPEPPVLAILPSGSGSDFIRTFALPRTIEAAADHLVGDEVYRCDVGVLEGSWGRRHFLNVADCGVIAATIPEAARLPRWMGGLRYVTGLWFALAKFRACDIELVVGERRYEGSAINVVAANAQFFGGGLNIAPKAILTDGEFDVQVFTGPRRQVFSLLPRVQRGLHLNHPGVRRLSGPAFRLATERPWPVEADGEMIGTTPVAGRVIPAAIDFKI
jgi:YegS/Rv2252/BmrU family lipid kinase